MKYLYCAPLPTSPTKQPQTPEPLRRSILFEPGFQSLNWPITETALRTRCPDSEVGAFLTVDG